MLWMFILEIVVVYDRPVLVFETSCIRHYILNSVCMEYMYYGFLY